MNALSMISIIIYTSFFIGAGRIVTAERKSSLNLPAGGVLLSLGWWSFCNSFLFVAETPELAMAWHKLGALGWCGFVAITVYYFIVLTDYNKQPQAWWKRVLFWAPPVILTAHNLLGSTTSLAQKLIPSISGWGWTYQNSLTSFWLWAYLLYVVAYFGLAFYLLFRWGKSAQHKMKKEMAVGFIVLDAITILFGVITDVILPFTYPALPALASVGTALFGIGYFAIIYRNDVFNINLVISSDDILQTSNNSIFVMDENQEILKYNRAVESLLGYNKNELLGANFLSLTAEEFNLNSLMLGDRFVDTEVKMRCKDGVVKDVLLSASVAKDKRHSFLCIIVSCQDVSKQKRVQQELSLEREKYKNLAGDYQRLAYYDPLTGLPNRRHFFDKLSVFETRYRTEQRDFAVIFLDLDNFKHANDVYGHKGGDELLKAAADKLQACVNDDEFVARLGGDEFMVMLPYHEAACMERTMGRIREEFHKKILFNGEPYEIGVSAGSGVFSQIGDATRLMQRADEAMYRNKKETVDKAFAAKERK